MFISNEKRKYCSISTLQNSHNTRYIPCVGFLCACVYVCYYVLLYWVCVKKSERGRWGESDWNVRAYSSLKFYQPYSHPTISTHNFSLPQIFSLLPSSFSKTFHTHKFWRSEVMLLLLLLLLVLLLLHIVCYDQNVFKLSQYNLITNSQLVWDIG